jgi:hypothetical protein
MTYCYDCAANVQEACGPNCLLGDDNRPMAQTTKEKQEAFRARQAMLGLSEVRGIYLPKELHQALKDYAQKLLAKNPTNGKPEG